ncbi:MAG: LON peptidase substrate-binding domain-containing protein [Planctomycetes bacterium]|nr:LON peptidase substrate-binding domain-containing protein [Planctomycetota bacterium]
MNDLVGRSPLFPLPFGALLPGQLLPLHVFEPRYRRMLEVVRKGDRMIAMATLATGWPVEALGNPPIHPVVGIGRLVKDKLNADGTSDIVLHGIVRGEITAEAGGEPYRQALVRLHPDDEDHPAIAYRLRRALLEGLSERLGGKLVCDVTTGFQPGGLVDRIAVGLDLDPEQRVELMQAIAPEKRVHLLIEVLGERRHRQKLFALVPKLAEFSLSLQDSKT